MSVLEVLGREAGKRRVPPPVLRTLQAQAQTSVKLVLFIPFYVHIDHVMVKSTFNKMFL